VTSSLIHPNDPPAADEVEVSVFGKGVGESLAVHLGAGEWLVADSFINDESGRPVVLDYLAAMGIPAEQAMKLVVVTHWHRDHTAGLAQIVKAVPSARVVFSLALRSDEFVSLLGADAANPDPDSSLQEMRRVMDLLQARRTAGRVQSASPVWAVANTLLHKNSLGEVFSLSPSSAAVKLGLEEIGSLLPRAGTTKRRLVAQGPNETCVVLSIRVGDRVVVLGADLEAGSDQTIGWKAIVASPSPPHGRASCLKVPHHGSKGADEPSHWHKHLDPSPIAVVTPYRALRAPIPTEADIARLSERTPFLYCAGSRRGRKTARRSSTVQKLTASKLHSIDGSVGHVRVRFLQGQSPVVACFGASEHLAVK
jgi:hypothetical protein